MLTIDEIVFPVALADDYRPKEILAITTHPSRFIYRYVSTGEFYQQIGEKLVDIFFLPFEFTLVFVDRKRLTLQELLHGPVVRGDGAHKSRVSVSNLISANILVLFSSQGLSLRNSIAQWAS